MQRQGGSSASRIRLLSGAVAALAAAFALTLAPAAALGAGWVQPFTVSPAGVDARAPQVALAPDGTAIALWVDDADDALYAAIRPRGGAFGSPTKISVNGNVSDPEVVANGTGGALAVWRRENAGVIAIEAALRPPASPFGAPVTVRSFVDAPTLLESNDLTSPEAALRDDGTAVVIWHRTYSKQPDNPNPGEEQAYVEASVWPASGPPGAPQELARQLGTDEDFPFDLDQPQVAFGADGRATAIWMRDFEQAAAPFFKERNIESASRSDAGFSSIVPVFKAAATDPRQDLPQLSAVPSDGARVVWRGGSAVWASREASGAYTTPDQLDSGGSMSSPQVAGRPTGAIAAWIKAGSELKAATAAPGADFGDAAPVPIPGTGTVRDLELASNPLGDQFAVWSRDGTGIGAAFAAPGSVLGSALTISGASTSAADPDVAVDAAGNGLAVWRRTDGAGGRIEAAIYERTPPSVPPQEGGGTAGGGTGGGSTGGGAAGGSVIFDRSAPVLSSLSLARSRFAVGTEPTPLSAARPGRGTTFRYTLSEPATVRILLERALAGRRVGKRCRRPTRRLRRKRRCTRYVAVGTLTRRAGAGANATAFSGRLGRRALRPDRYRATITATDAAGNRSAARRTTFTIVRFI